ncbi:LysM receptor kinase 1b [Medicago truncatula]|uniref:LysM receptor kinase 1b n=1 Tax=Medicago truncatula TaxID=3880 RepID=G7K7N0_MEDTR|nr:LysM receptor kinase 1b [Medicago truncatula]
MKPIIKFRLSLLFLLLVSQSITSESKCNKTCDLALASYYIRPGTTLANISKVMQSNVVSKAEDISIYNIYTILSVDSVQVYTRLNVPFPCDCINDEFLGHTFLYKLRHGDSYASIATTTFGNLVTEEWIERVNVYPRTYVPDSVMINVTVNCSCGNGEVSKDYGLFITYPLRPDDTLESIAKYTKVKGELLQRYNPGVNFSQGRGLVYIPGKDENGVYVPLPSRKAGFTFKLTRELAILMTIYFCHLARSLVAAGICIRGVCMVLLLAICIYVRYFRKKNGEEESKLPPEDSMSPSTKDGICTTFVLKFLA